MSMWILVEKRGYAKFFWPFPNSHLLYTERVREDAYHERILFDGCKRNGFKID
jgi:hypothetical protein